MCLAVLFNKRPSQASYQGFLTWVTSRKYPHFEQSEIFSLQDAFRKLDVDDKGYLDETTVIKATQQSERQPYDVVRQALKEVDLDSSRRVELEDYVDVRVCIFVAARTMRS
jgi:Ca2+-binding EF-hand superfamily protein